jgi:hypothetical protein
LTLVSTASRRTTAIFWAALGISVTLEVTLEVWGTVGPRSWSRGQP